MNLGDGIYVDGSWELSVLIDDLQVTKRIRVSGETHVGGLMLKLVDAIDVKMDWSDHALWWPQMNCWLLKTRHSLDQCGVQADACLEFHRMHHYCRVQLPDLQEKELQLNFAQTVFSVVATLCKDLGIRRSEELSLKRQDPLAAQLQEQQLRSRSVFSFNSLRRSGSRTDSLYQQKQKQQMKRRSDTFNPLVPKSVESGPNGTTPASPPDAVATQVGSPTSHGLMSPLSVNSLAFEGADESILANSQHVSLSSAFSERGVTKLRTFTEKAASTAMWLDSSKSLMEQGFRPAYEDCLLLLRFKFCSFYDLNIKYDAIRINQLFHQAKWTLLTEEVDCTDEEAFLLAGLQLQAHLQANQPAKQSSDGNILENGEESAADDEIDAALADLEMSLLCDTPQAKQEHMQRQQQQQQNRRRSSSTELEAEPELVGFMKFFKPKRFTLKNYKKYYFVLRDTTLRMFADQAAAARSECLEAFELKNSEATPDLNLTTQKFGIRVHVLGKGGHMQEMWLRCESKEHFADWMTAISLASRGKTLASRLLFENEVKEMLTHIELQAPKPQPVLTVESMPHIELADYVPARVIRRHKSQALMQQVLERHANVRDKNLLEAKLDYIKTWQRLPGHGIAYFLVNYSETRRRPMTFSEFRKQRHHKQELFGVSFNRVMRLDPVSGDTLNTWRYYELGSWTINWEVLTLTIRLSRPPHQMTLNPCCPHAAASKQSLCKTLGEFIGGYVFLSLRKPDKSQVIDEQMFHKLTGSRDHV